MLPKNGNRIMLFLVLYMLALNVGIYYLLLSVQLSVPGLMLINQLLSFVIPVCLYLLISRRKVLEVLSLKKVSAINVILLILMSLTIQPFTMLLSGISTLFFPNVVSELVADMSDSFLISILTIALLPSICEELMFRGLLFSHYKSIPIKKAALINGLFFGIIHFNPQQFLYAFLLGFIMAYFVYYTRSIFSSILAHFIINASQVSLATLSVKLSNDPATAAELSGVLPEGMSETMMSILSAGILSVIFLPVFVIIFLLFIKINKQMNFKEDVLGNGLTEASLFHETGESLVIPPKLSVFTPSFFVVIVIYLLITVAYFGSVAL